MQSVMLVFQLVAAAAAPHGSTRTFVVAGKSIVVTVDALDPVLEVTPQAGTKVPAVATYLAYINALAAGSIAEAAALTSTPAKTVAKQNAYLAQVGSMESFKASYAKALTEHLTLTHIITKDRGVLILGQHPQHGAFATFLKCTGAKCAIADALDAPPLSDLAKLFGALREGTVSL